MAYLTEEMSKMTKLVKKLKKCTVGRVHVTRRIMIPTVTRIVGPVAREI